MMTEVCVTAPAKINIGLHVLPGRANGFHTIESIFQTVTLFDTLVVRASEKKGCIVECEDMKLPSDNTILSSYNAFRSVTGMDDFGVHVALEKRIPSGGGLGGGSSDAAACIRAFEALNKITLSVRQLESIASKIGSDVFFFLLCGAEGCAVVTGRGEIVKPIHARDDLFMLLVFPGVHSSTQEAYALFDDGCAAGKIVPCPAYADLETVYKTPASSWNFANSFTPYLVSRFPEIGFALDDLRREGALFAEMSGSGSTVYGIFPSEEEAENVRSVLASRWKGTFVVRPFQTPKLVSTNGGTYADYGVAHSEGGRRG